MEEKNSLINFSFIILILASVGIFSVFLFQAFWSFNFDTKIAHQTDIGVLYIKASIFSLIILYSIFACVLLLVKKLPWKAVLWTIIIFSGLSIAAALITYMTRSQDVLWNLLVVKGFSFHGLNPYDTSPNMLGFDSWSSYVRDWRDDSMFYGPVWVLLFVPFSLISNIITAAMLTKILGALAVIASLFIFWKILKEHHFAFEKRVALFGLAALNPFIIQHGIVDFHGDILLMMLVLASYLFALKKQWYLSYSVIILAGFIKYTPWLLALIPIYFYFQSSRTQRQKILAILFFIGFPLLIALIAYAPFDYGSSTISTVSAKLDKNIATVKGVAPGAYVLTMIFGVSAVAIKKIGIIAAGLTMLWFVLRKKMLHAYIMPFFVFYMFVPWFQAWYFLWILPLTLLLWPPLLLVLISTLFLIIMEIGTVLGVWLLIFGALFLYGFKEN